MTMQPLPPRLIDAAGLADGTYGLHVVGGKVVELLPAAGGSLTVQDENGNVATGVTQLDFQGAGVSAAAGSGEVVVAVPGSTSGGGTGGVGRDRRWNKSSLSTTVDEYDDDVLDPAWVRVDGTGAPAANVAWVEGADVISAVQSAGDSTAGPLHALMRPLTTGISVGDAFVTGVQMLVPMANFPTAGIVLADGTTFGSGNQVVGIVGSGTVSVQTDMNVGCWPYTGYNTRGTPLATSGAISRGNYVFLRLVCTAANTWRTDFSPDGVGWLTGPTLSKTVTPTHVGLLCTTFGQSGTKFIASFDFLRRQSGIS